MKRRILSLLMALCMVLSLLPATVFAAEPATVTATIAGLNMTAAVGEIKYATLGATGGAVDATTQGESGAWNIKLDNKTGDVAVLSLRNITNYYDGNAQAVFDLSGDGALRIEVLTACTINFKWRRAFKLAMAGGTTITSTENSLLTLAPGSGVNHVAFNCIEVTAGDLTLENANISAYSALSGSPYTAGGITTDMGCTIQTAGNMTVKGDTLTCQGAGYSKGLQVGGALTIENGATVTVPGERTNTINISGDITINNATLIGSITNGTLGADLFVMNKMPTTMVEVIAKYSTVASGANLVDLLADADIPGLKARYVEFRAAHTCSYAGDCTQAATCSCGKTLDAQAGHTFAEGSDACAMPGCEFVRPAALYAAIGGTTLDTAYGEIKYAFIDEVGVVTEVAETDDWNVKLDNTGDEAVLSLDGIDAAVTGDHPLRDAYFNIHGDGALKIEVLSASTIVYKWREGFELAMGGGTTITSKDEDCLLTMSILDENQQSATANIKVTLGTLTFDNAYVHTTIVGDQERKYVGGEIAVGVNAADDVTILGGDVQFENRGSYAQTMNVAGDLTIENGAKVTVLNDGFNYTICVDGAFVVNNSTLTGMLLNGVPSAEHYVVNKMPTISDGMIVKYSDEPHGPDLVAISKDADLISLGAKYVVFRVPTTCDINGNHNAFAPVSSTVTEPTCTEEGYTTFTCECGDVYTGNYVDALSHTPGKPVPDTENNQWVISCTVCTNEISRESAECEHTGGTATCEELAKCEKCGEP